MSSRTWNPRRMSGVEKTDFSCEKEIMHDLWVERELRIVAAEPTFLLIAWVLVPAWSLWQAFGPQKAKNIEEGLVFPPLAAVASPILLLSLLAALIASTVSLLSQVLLPATIRNTPPAEWAMTSCVLYQAVVACTWVLDHSFSTLDLAPFVYMFAVTGIMWSTLTLTPCHNAFV